MRSNTGGRHFKCARRPGSYAEGGIKEMRDIVRTYAERFRHERRVRIRTVFVLTVLALVVCAGVFWQLHTDGLAMADGTGCGMEEHEHSAEAGCYEGDVLICGITEHVHTPECMTNEGAAETEPAADAEPSTDAETGADAEPAADREDMLPVEETPEADSSPAMICEETVYEASDGGVNVTVTAPAGSVPEEAKLRVTVYDTDSDEYAAAKEAVGLGSGEQAQEWKENTLVWTCAEDNLLVLDISFVTDGCETEPVGTVEVAIDAAHAISEDADIETLEVHHLEETESGMEAVIVADAGSRSEGSVDEETAVATFCADSLSPFTVQWSPASSRTATITVNVLDTENDNQTIGTAQGTYAFVTDSSRTGLTTTYTTTLDVGTLAGGVKLGSGYEGYTFAYAEAVYNEANTYGSEDAPLTSVDIQKTSASNGSTVYTFYYGRFSGAETHSRSNNSSVVTLNLYYKHVEPSVKISASAIPGDEHVSGYNLSQTNEHFDYDEHLEISWGVEPEELAELKDNGDGTAVLIWLDDDQDLSGMSVTVTVTAKGMNKQGGTAEAADSLVLTYDAAQVKTVEIEDDIKYNGDLVAIVRGDDGNEIFDHSGLIFVWYMSDDSGSETDDTQSMIDSLLRSTEYTEITNEDVFDETDTEEPDDDRALNVARERGGLHAFYVEVYDKTDTGFDNCLAESEPFYVPYAMKLLNGSFEYPNVGNIMEHPTYDCVPYWSTTADDRLIEIVPYSNSSGWGTQYTSGRVTTTIYAGGSQTLAGNQYAELNAESYGALYQDVLTAPGSELTWNVSHRARTSGWSRNFDATNAMYVVMMSANDAEMLLSGVSQADQQNVVLAMLESAGSGSSVGTTGVSGQEYQLTAGTYAGEATVTFSAWYETVATEQHGAWTDNVSGTYTVPADQYLTRFFFVAEHGYSPVDENDPTVGNLLDMAEFSQMITWHIDIYVYDAETDTYVLMNDMSTSGRNDVFEYVNADYDLSGYHLVGSVTGNETGGENPSFDRHTHDNMLLDQNSNYLSLYLMENGAVVRKTLEGFTDEQLDEIYKSESESGNAVFSLTDENGDVVESYGSLTVEVGDEGTGLHVLSPLESGNYTITETGYAKELLDGTYVWQKVTASVNEKEQDLTQGDDGSYSLNFDLDDYAEIGFVNYYVPQLTIVKTDWGDPDIKLAGAQFILSKTVSEDGKTVRSYYTSGGWVADETEAEKLTTQDDGIVIAVLWDGTENAEYSLTEIKTPDGYALPEGPVTFTVTDGVINVSEGLNSATAEGMTLEIKNAAGTELPETGGSGTGMFTLFGVLLTCFAAGFLFRSRRQGNGCPDR